MEYILISKIKNYSLKIILFLIFLLIALQLVTVGYSREGRWDLNEHIASGLNLKHYGDLYKTPNEGFLSIKSPYPPGLAIIISLLPISNVATLNVLLLILASLVCLTFLGVLHIPITSNLEKNHPDKTFINIVILGIGGTFAIYLTYAAEFKLDSLILIIVIVSTLLITKNKGNKLSINLFVITIGFVGLLFKQQFLFAFLINLCLIFYNTLYKKQFFNFFLIAGFIVIFCALVFKREYIEYAFIKPSGHPYLIKDGLGYLYDSFKVRHVLFLVLFFTIVGYYVRLFFEIKRTGLFLSFNKLENLFLMHASFWFVSQIGMSVFKWGGNMGNVESSLLLFIPFVAKQINNEVKTDRNRLLLAFSLLILVFMITMSIIGHGKNQLHLKETTKVAISGLSEDIGMTRKSNILIADDLFVYFKEASYENLNSFDAIFAFFLNPRKNSFNFLDYFDKRVNAEPNKIQYIVLNSSLKGYESSCSGPIWQNSLAPTLFQKINAQFVLVKTYSTLAGEPVLYVYKNNK